MQHTPSNPRYSLYTSVARQGNDILYMGYDTDGEPVKQRIRFEPEIFFERAGGEYKTLQGHSCERKEFSNISEVYDFTKMYKDVYKLYGCQDYVRQWVGRNFRGELKPQFSLVATWFWDIETKLELGGFPEPEQAQEKISLITLYHQNSGKIYTWGLHPVDDPEMNSKNSAEQIAEDMKFMQDHKVDYRSFSDEKSMLKDFLMFVRSNRLDILSGWNSEFFDAPYVYNRLKNVLGEKLANYMSPWGIVDESRVMISETQSRQTFEFVGMNHLDLMDLFKKFEPGSQEEWNLKFIAQVILGETKVDLPGSDFKDSYENYWSTFVRYNIVDVLLLAKIDAKKKILQLAMSAAYNAKCQYSETLSAMRLWESITYNYLMEKGIVEDWEKKRPRKQPLVGAYVHEVKPGKYKWVTSIDATSLYPFIMMMLNISPEKKKRREDFVVEELTKFGADPKIEYPSFSWATTETRVYSHHNKNKFDPETELCGANGTIFDKTSDGFFRTIIREMYDGRNAAKKEMLALKKELEKMKTEGCKDSVKMKEMDDAITSLNLKQFFGKLSLNSVYGCLSMVYFRYFDHDSAEAVTTTGQLIIQNTMKCINAMLSKLLGPGDYVVASDTDSVYINLDKMVEKHCQGKTDSEIVNWIEKFVIKVLQVEVNKYLDDLMANFGVPKNIVTFKLEGISDSAIWLAKKRYACNLLYNEGVRYDPPDVKVMGMEIVRSSTPSYIKDELLNGLKICLDGQEEDLHELVSKAREDFEKKDIEDISFPRGCNGMDVYADEVSIYKKKTPMHVRAALLHNDFAKRKGFDRIKPIENGDRIKFIHLKMPNPVHEDIIAYVGKMPKEFALEKYIDRKLQFEKVFIGPLKGILDAIDWTTEPVNTLFD